MCRKALSWGPGTNLGAQEMPEITLSRVPWGERVGKMIETSWLQDPRPHSTLYTYLPNVHVFPRTFIHSLIHSFRSCNVVNRCTYSFWDYSFPWPAPTCLFLKTRRRAPSRVEAGTGKQETTENRNICSSVFRCGFWMPAYLHYSFPSAVSENNITSTNVVNSTCQDGYISRT